MTHKWWAYASGGDKRSSRLVVNASTPKADVLLVHAPDVGPHSWDVQLRLQACLNRPRIAYPG
jgi:hypothetical protein